MYKTIKFQGRSGFAKIGIYESSELTFRFPTIIGINGLAPFPSELVLKRFKNQLFLNNIPINVSKTRKAEYTEIYKDIVLVSNLSSLLNRPQEFIKFLVDMRKDIGYKKLVYAPFLGTPIQIPILIYLGIDMLDLSYTYLISKKGYEFKRFGVVPGTYNLEKNVEFSATLLNETVEAIMQNKLRDYVESMPDFTTKSLLRTLDLYFYKDIEPFYPVWERELNVIHFDALFRADVRRFMQRVEERYQKPELYTTLLILPCSAKKPYSLSRSHQFYHKILRDTGRMVHELIVTSPPAVVPRELEAVYPVQNYDISVIGYWYEEEIKTIITQLKRYLQKNKYDYIIGYLPESMRFLESTLNEFGAFTIFGDLRTTENVNRLKTLIKNTNSKKLSRKYQIRTELKAITQYQFGQVFNSVFDRLKVAGKYPNLELLFENKHFMHFVRDKGTVTLSIDAAKILAKNGVYTVKIEDFEPKSTIFAVGIIDATHDIRKEDEVAVVIDDRVVGVGTAKMNYIDMIDQEYGVAVKLRAFKKP